MNEPELKKALEELTLEGAVSVMVQAMASLQGNRFDAIFFQNVEQKIVSALVDCGALKIEGQPAKVQAVPVPEVAVETAATPSQAVG